MRENETHDFRTDLVWANGPEATGSIDAWYRKREKTIVEINRYPKDMERQLAGIDTELVFADGRIMKIEEKIRRVFYFDVLLEYISNDRYGTVGYIEKPCMADNYAYGDIETGEYTLYPVKALQGVWRANKDTWLKCSGWRKESKNEKNGRIYYSLGCAVPVDIIKSEIGHWEQN